MNMLTELLSTAAAQRVGWALVHFLWQGAAVALLLALLLGRLRNRSAQVRWALSCAALGLMALLPVVTALVADVTERRPAAAGGAETMVVMPAVAGGTSGATAEGPASEWPRPAVQDAARPWPSAIAVLPRGDAAAGAWLSRWRGAIQPLLPGMIGAWLVGVALLSVWHLGGWVAVRRLQRIGTQAVAPELQAILAQLRPRVGLRRPVRLLASVRVAVPVVVGWLRPVVLVPACALSGLTPGQWEAILAHELAHIRRWDPLVLALQAVIETLLFYHPAVWWVSRQIRQESEQCCDDLAVRLCGDRRGYARALATVAEGGAGGPALALGSGGGAVLARIRRILGVPAAPPRSFGRCLSGILALVLLLALGSAAGVFSALPPATAAPAPATDETEAGLTPTLVTLDLTEADARAVVAALEKASGYKIEARHHDMFGVERPRATLKLDKVPFWEAVAKISEQIPLQAVPGSYKGVELDIQKYHESIAKWQQGSGLLAFRLLELTRTSSAKLDGEADPVKSSFTAHLLVMADPKLAIARGPASLHITKALDNRGHSLRYDGEPDTSSAQGFVWQHYVPLSYPADAGESVAVLAGTARCTAILKIAQLEFDNLAALAAAASEPREFAGMKVTVGKLRQEPSRLTVEVQFERGTADPALFGNYFGAQRHWLGVWLVDAAGQRRAWSNGGGSEQSDTVHHRYTFDLGPANAARNPAKFAPAKLCIAAPERIRELEIPFEFKDIPLP